MEKLQGPINPCFLGEHLNLELLEQGEKAFDFTHGLSLISTESFRLEEERKPFAIPSLQDKMPFLQMLQSVESPTFTSLIEPSFQLLLRLQQQKPWGRNNWTEVDPCAQTLEPESCITHDISEAYSPVKSETKITHDISEAHSTVKSETKEPHHPQSSSCLEVVSSACNVGPNSPENCGAENSGTPSNRVDDRLMVKSSPQFTMPAPVTREKRKRKRARPSKNKEEVETQRMTHIAVERNRRRQMNDHLNALRSLMPTSFIQRGDQASIIGGAIDFVKELEQLLQSLQAQKRIRKTEEEGNGDNSENHHNHRDPDSSALPFNGFFISPQYTTYSSLTSSDIKYTGEEEFTAENKSAVADIEVIVIHTHVNLKILSARRPGQLLKVIAALEDLRLTILHLNITSSQRSVLYSFNLKMEDDCKLGSADEIAAAVHQVFSLINGQ